MGIRPDRRPNSAAFAACLCRFRLRFSPLPAGSGPAAIPGCRAEPCVMDASNRSPRQRNPCKPVTQAGS